MVSCPSMPLTDRKIKIIICVLFFTSGFAGLVYEVIWVRMLHLILGSTTYAVTLVLTAFMAGLALGSYLAGRHIDKSGRALKIYALLEAGVGLFALLSPVLLGLINPLYIQLHAGLHDSPHLLYLVRFLLAFVVLVIPTTLMGATLPVLSKLIVKKRSSLGKDIGCLYGYNTIGATLGCFGTGFIFIHSFGIGWTISAAAVLNILVAIIALQLGRTLAEPVLQPEQSIPPEKTQPAKKPKKQIMAAETGYSNSLLSLVLFMFGLSGFISLGYEVLWARAISFFAGNTSYAFSTMLTTFLLGIGLGSLLATKFSDKLKRPLLGFGLAEIMIGFCAIATIPMFARFFYLLRPEIYGENPATPVWMKFCFSFLAMFIPTLLMGAVFPLVGRIYTHTLKKVGRSIGNLYSINTVGSILGSAAAGFVLVPLLGIQKSILLLSILQISIGAIIIMCSPELQPARRLSIVTPFVLIALALTVIAPVRGNTYSSAHRSNMPNGAPIYYREGVSNIVEVLQESEDSRHLILTGGVNASTSSHGVGLRIHRLMSQLPLLLHENPQSILLIALGSGMTAGATLAFDNLKTIDCAEISRDVVDAAGYFRLWNHDIVNSPRFNLVIEDGRNFVLTTPRKYDVITAGIIHPKYNSGNAGFYSKDYYEICKRKLKPGGIVCQWAPLYGLTVDEFKMIINTFLEVFPHGSLWFAQNYGQLGNSNALLIGSLDSLGISYAGLKKYFQKQAVGDDLREEGIDNVVELLDCFILGGDALRDFARGRNRITTDNHPILEFGQIEMHYDEILRMMAELREPIQPYLTNFESAASSEMIAISDSLRIQYEVSNYCIQGDIHILEIDFNQALAEYGRALEILPDNPDLRLQYRDVQLRANNHLIREFMAKNQGQNDMIKRFAQRLQYKPNDAESQFNIGLVYQQKGWLDAAMTQYQDAIRLDPDNPLIRHNLALLYDQKGWSEKALEELDRVIAMDSTLAAPCVYCGIIHKRMGDLESARKMFTRALILDPDNKIANEQLAELK
jgi:spermidine synthase